MALAAQAVDKGFSISYRKRACVASLPPYFLCHTEFREVAHGGVLELTEVLALCSPLILQFAGSISIQTNRKRYQPLYYWNQTKIKY